MFGNYTNNNIKLMLDYITLVYNTQMVSDMTEKIH